MTARQKEAFRPQVNQFNTNSASRRLRQLAVPLLDLNYRQSRNSGRRRRTLPGMLVIFQFRDPSDHFQYLLLGTELLVEVADEVAW